jgi:SAM-dependent methyltransferase
MSNPAETYEREIVPALFRPWAPLLVDAARLTAGERALDVACGTGVVAREAARRVGTGGRVVGVDLNPAMIAVARDAARREGAGAIEWLEGRAEALPVPDGGFDAVLCQHGLQFVPDKPKAIAEMRRALAPDGRVAIAVWRGLDHHPFFGAMNDSIVKHLGIPALAAPFSFGQTTALWELLDAGGFVEIDIDARSMPSRYPNPGNFIAMEVDVITAAIPSVQHLDEKGRAELRQAIEADATQLVRNATEGDHVVIPMYAHIAKAKRG